VVARNQARNIGQGAVVRQAPCVEVEAHLSFLRENGNATSNKSRAAREAANAKGIAQPRR
ncbi:hypothetical protein, partial [Stutzerimonas nitrititolerans]|uniref:hypothetical protein n=1 Tax=Stutzerimonas nitrititolerans TaxID=2482751 RepID=UPI00289FF627